MRCRHYIYIYIIPPCVRPCLTLTHHVDLCGALVVRAAAVGRGCVVGLRAVGRGCVVGLRAVGLRAAGAFPTSLFTKYYNNPTQTASQLQPVIKDPVETGVTYKLGLTSPDDIPQSDTADPHPLPDAASAAQLLEQAYAQILAIAANPLYTANTCAGCQAALQVAKFMSLAAPQQGPALAVRLCEHFNFSTTCERSFGALALGGVVTQVVANANVGGYDGQVRVALAFAGELCVLSPAAPHTDALREFHQRTLPAAARVASESDVVVCEAEAQSAAPAETAQRQNPEGAAHVRFPPGPTVRHGVRGELHLGPVLPREQLQPGERAHAAVAGAAFRRLPLVSAPVASRRAVCADRDSSDTPMALAAAAVEAIPVLTGTQGDGFAFTVYTGDLVSHDVENQLSRDYVRYTETLLYDLFRKTLGSGPVYAALGNHDSYNQAQDAPHMLGKKLGSQFSWNYDHVAALWAHENWLPEAAVELAKAHYAAYMVRRKDGLRVITLNTDLWYRANYFNYINLDQPDNSGMLRFLTDELQAAEDAGERVWIVGHVLTGWDGSNPLVNPTDLFYQIVDRYSPHVIANIFFGHTHEDQLTIFYANNATDISAQTALTQSWIGPSITPLTNLNSGFRMYEVDSATFDVMEAYTWRADVNAFGALDNQTKVGPTYAFEYSTRDAYGPSVPGWTSSDPLNATFWHHVTEAMEADPALVTTFNTFQGKSSVLSPACTGDCVKAKICYIRSASAAIAKQNCIQGFGSVQYPVMMPNADARAAALGVWEEDEHPDRQAFVDYDNAEPRV
ncbi:unnamed protein product [Mycena citricolor]|uniref:Calcineurin-like phosphoesterase domain-containing protein n=1 Tax=Mycena citricolor TaxID=2018698 RepID=A0AAD2GVF9_9AGAR|nr:unnamed protein product [Mycena citricolor]